LLDQRLTLVWASWQLDTATAAAGAPPIVRIGLPTIPGQPGL